MCAAVGVPLVAVFGPTPPGEWKPIGDSYIAVRSSSCTVDDVEVDAVYAQVTLLLQQSRPGVERLTHLSTSDRGSSHP